MIRAHTAPLRGYRLNPVCIRRLPAIPKMKASAGAIAPDKAVTVSADSFFVFRASGKHDRKSEGPESPVQYLNPESNFRN